MTSHSCARRAAEPDNEHAGCTRHCGNEAACPSAAGNLRAETVSELTRLIRRALNQPHGQDIAAALQRARAEIERPSPA